MYSYRGKWAKILTKLQKVLPIAKDTGPNDQISSITVIIITNVVTRKFFCRVFLLSPPLLFSFPSIPRHLPFPFPSLIIPFVVVWCSHRGSNGPTEHFLRTTYLPIWLPMTCWSEMPHYCWDCRVVIHMQKIVQRIFNHIKHTERSPIRISLFYYDMTYSLYSHRPSINTV